MNITAASEVTRNEAILTNNIDGEVGMLNVQSGKYYGLDAVGSDVWALMAERVSVKAIVHAMMQNYAVEEERCEQDILALLEKLQQSDLIHVHNP